MKRWLQNALTLGVFLPSLVFAETASRTVLGPPSASEASRLRAGVSGEASGASSVTLAQLRFESMQYMREVPETPDLTNSQFLSARLADEGSLFAPWFSYEVDFAAGTFFRRSQSQFVVHEALLAAQLSDTMVFSVGRQKQPWSEIDSRWNLGLWQPYFAIDALRPEQQGLTGAFLDLKTEEFQIVGFVTPIFIPTMGPEIREENGSLEADSRWYRQPSSTQQFNGRSMVVDYNLDVPELSKLVLKPASAVMARLGSVDSGPWINVAWGLKPVNDLLLTRLNFMQIQLASENFFDVTVSPDVTYHEIASADVGYAIGAVRVSASILADRPREKEAPTERAIQRLAPLQATSLQLDWDLPAIRMQLGYMRVTGGGIVDVTENGRPDDFTMFDSRLKFTNAGSVGVEGQVATLYRRPLVTKFRYLYDWDQAGSLATTELQFYPDPHWAVVAGVDLLGVDDESRDPAGFLNQFRANDRVYGGMTYVF